MKSYIQGIITRAGMVSALFVFMGTGTTSDEYLAKRLHEIEVKIDDMSKDTENTNYWIQDIQSQGIKANGGYVVCK